MDNVYTRHGHYCIADAYLLCKEAFPEANVSMPSEPFPNTVIVEMKDGRSFRFRVQSDMGVLSMRSPDALFKDFDSLVTAFGGNFTAHGDGKLDISSPVITEVADRVSKLEVIEKTHPYSGAGWMAKDITLLSNLVSDIATDMDVVEAVERERDQDSIYKNYLIPRSRFDDWSKKDDLGIPIMRNIVGENVTVTRPIGPVGDTYCDWRGEKGRVRFTHDSGGFVDVFVDVLPLGVTGQYLKTDASLLNGGVILSMPAAISKEDEAAWLTDLRRNLTNGASDLDVLVDQEISFRAEELGYDELRYAPAITATKNFKKHEFRNHSALAIPMENIEGVANNMADMPSTASEVLKHLLDTYAANGMLGNRKVDISLVRDVYGRAVKDTIAIANRHHADEMEKTFVSFDTGFAGDEIESARICNINDCLAVCIASDSSAERVNQISSFLREVVDARPVVEMAEEIKKENDREDREGDIKGPSL